MAITTDLSDEQLLEAWRQRRRPNWPALFEDAMRDPVYARLVRMHALHAPPTRQRPAIERPDPPQACADAPMPPARAARTAAPQQPALFDRKRLAAGEREDEE